MPVPRVTAKPVPGTEFSEGWCEFTQDWFNHRIPAWKKHIVPVYAGKETHWLEIGSYEGRSAIWTLENILTHENSLLTCIDPWPYPRVEALFDKNMSVAVEHLKRSTFSFSKLKGFSQDLLPQVAKGYQFDVIYIDGDHQAKSALTDAVLSWPLLKKGGFLIFDDYRWNYPDPKDRATKKPARFGIDAFLSLWESELSIVHQEYQVIVQKLK